MEARARTRTRATLTHTYLFRGRPAENEREHERSHLLRTRANRQKATHNATQDRNVLLDGRNSRDKGGEERLPAMNPHVLEALNEGLDEVKKAQPALRS